MKIKDSRTIASEIESKIKEIPGIQSIEVSSGSFADQLLFGGGKPVSIEIYGDDIEKTDSIANLIKEKIEKIKGTVGVTISRQSANPEIKN